MKTCKYCGAIIINEICPVCNRTFITPPTLSNAALFDLNPHLKKRFEWRENIRRTTGMPELPVDPTKFNLEDLPPKNIPKDIELPRKKKKDKDIERLEF
ncbi:MAG: hypothetical protein HWN65_23880 [Candidatus Helarchaeota archaeon]|nr:hypothetical protein [Candidatus Helarchaeota archaeon]